MQGASLLWCAGPAALSSFPMIQTAPPTVAGPSPAPVPDPAHECLMQAHAALSSGRADVALGWFRNAAALDSSSMPRLGAAICLMELGREDEAARELESAYDASEKPGEVDVQLARIFHLGGQRQAAFVSLGIAIAQDPTWVAVVKDDRAFGDLRDHPSFLQVLGEI